MNVSRFLVSLSDYSRPEILFRSRLGLVVPVKRFLKFYFLLLSGTFRRQGMLGFFCRHLSEECFVFHRDKGCLVLSERVSLLVSHVTLVCAWKILRVSVLGEGSSMGIRYNSAGRDRLFPNRGQIVRGWSFTVDSAVFRVKWSSE